MEVIIWLSLDIILGKFHSDVNIARLNYEKYINFDGHLEENVDVELFRNGSHEGKFLGTDAFAERVLIANEQVTNASKLISYTLEELIDFVCMVLNKPSSVVRMSGKEREGSQARAIVGYFVKKTQHLTLKEFAGFVCKDLSSLSKLVRDIELKAQKDEGIASILKEIQQKLTEI